MSTMELIPRRGVWAAILRFLSWLWHSRRRRKVVSIPVAASCQHKHDPHAVLSSLLHSVGNPTKFAETLAEFANCAGCTTAVISEAVYELAGQAFDQQDTEVEPDGDLLVCVCQHRRDPGSVALQLGVCLDDYDGDAGQDQAIDHALGRTKYCRACLVDALVAASRTIVGVLNVSGYASVWRPIFAQHLFEALDAEQRGGG